MSVSPCDFTFYNLVIPNIVYARAVSDNCIVPVKRVLEFKEDSQSKDPKLYNDKVILATLKEQIEVHRDPKAHDDSAILASLKGRVLGYPFEIFFQFNIRVFKITI